MGANHRIGRARKQAVNINSLFDLLNSVPVPLRYTAFFPSGADLAGGPRQEKLAVYLSGTGTGLRR